MERLAAAGRPAEPADARNFEGGGTLTRFLSARPDARGRVFSVSFDAGSRTNWHRHSDVQILFVIQGRCRIQTWQGPVEVAEAGDVVRFEAGEKHWHGATRDGPMTHLAVNLGATTEWLEAVEPGSGSRD